MNVSCAIKTAKRSPLSRSTSGRSDTSENRRYELYSHLRIAISSGCTLRSTSGRFDTSKKEYPNTLLWLLGDPSRVDISSCTRSRGAQAYPWHTERGRFQRLGGMIADNHISVNHIASQPPDLGMRHNTPWQVCIFTVASSLTRCGAYILLQEDVYPKTWSQHHRCMRLSVKQESLTGKPAAD